MLGCMDAQGVLAQNRTILPIQTVLFGLARLIKANVDTLTTSGVGMLCARLAAASLWVVCLF